jgi:hypothetical protein
MIFLNKNKYLNIYFYIFYYFREMVECPCRVCQPPSRSWSCSTHQLGGAAQTASHLVGANKGVVATGPNQTED